MSGQWKKDACASFTHNLLLILGLCTTTLFGLYECVLLTCLGTLCRHIDEVQSTLRQCRGKGCPELSASWAETMKDNTGIRTITGFSCSSTEYQSVSFCFASRQS